MWYYCNSSWKCDIFATVMRYSYLIKDEQGKEEEHKAMSYKKLLKKLSSNYKDQSVVKISYTNKKKNKLIKFVKIKKTDWFI